MLASKRQAKAIKASPGPRVSPQSQARGKGDENNGNPKGSPREPKVRSKGKTLKTDVKSETRAGNKESVQTGQVCITKTDLRTFET